MAKEVTIKVGNINSRIFGYLDEETKNEIYEKLSYRRKGDIYSSKFIDGKWDGFRRLFKQYKKIFPTGVITKVIKILKSNRYKISIDDTRIKPDKNRIWKFIPEIEDFEYFDFQEEAIYQGKKYGRGVFAMPTGSGKTLTFIGLMSEIEIAPTIVFVPSLLLLKQTKEVIEKTLKDVNGESVKVGIVGDGFCEIEDITVMTIQTAITAFDIEYNKDKDTIKYLTAEEIKIKNKMLKKKKRKNYEDPDASEDLSFIITRKDVLKDLINNAKMIICDECHRASSVIYQEVLKHCQTAYYRYAFSGTAKREDGTEMLIYSSFGKKLIDISTSELIRRGVLARPYIFLVEVPQEEDTPLNTYDKIRKYYVVKSEFRNRMIADIIDVVKEVGPTLGLVDIISHGETLENMVPYSLFIKGKDKSSKKDNAINDLLSGELPVLIATPIFDEGLDLVQLEGLVLCSGGKSETKLRQRIGRALRIDKKGKKECAIIIDFYDKQKYLEAHAKRRLKIYLDEEEFIVTIIKDGKYKTIQGGN